MRKLYTKVDKKETLEEFILALYTTYGGLDRCVETYYDKDCQNKEFKIARRSFEDLLVIVNTVYDNISKKELIDLIYKLSERDGKKLLAFYCSDINKWVFRFYTSNAYYYKLMQSFGNNIKCFEEKGNGEYSLKDLLDLAGFKDNYKIKNE